MKEGFLTTVNPFDAISTAVQTALSTVQTNTFDLIGDVLPAGLAIMGAILTVRLGIKAFKAVTGR